MNGITISIIKDIEEIELLHDRQSFDYTYDSNTIKLLKKNFLLDDSLYLIVKKDAKFVAFCSMDKDWWEENYFFIREILVDQNFQKLGIGKKLIEQCIQHAKNKQAIGVITETAFENSPMQNLCEKLGFKKWANPEWRKGITYKLLF